MAKAFNDLLKALGRVEAQLTWTKIDELTEIQLTGIHVFFGSHEEKRYWKRTYLNSSVESDFTTTELASKDYIRDRIRKISEIRRIKT